MHCPENNPNSSPITLFGRVIHSTEGIIEYDENGVLSKCSKTLVSNTDWETEGVSSFDVGNIEKEIGANVTKYTFTGICIQDEMSMFHDIYQGNITICFNNHLKTVTFYGRLINRDDGGILPLGDYCHILCRNNL